MNKQNSKIPKQILIGYNNPVVVKAHRQTNPPQVDLHPVKLHLTPHSHTHHRHAIKSIITLHLVLALFLHRRFIINHKAIRQIDQSLHHMTYHHIQLGTQLQLVSRQLPNRLTITFSSQSHFARVQQPFRQFRFNVFHNRLHRVHRLAFPHRLQQSLHFRFHTHFRGNRCHWRTSHQVLFLRLTNVWKNNQKGNGTIRQFAPSQGKWMDDVTKTTVQVLCQNSDLFHTPSKNRQYSGYSWA